MFGLDFGKGFDGGIPVTDIANRSVEGIAEGFLLVNPLGVVTCGAAACNNGETFFGQALADGGTDAAHAARDVCYFFTHFCLLGNIKK